MQTRRPRRDTGLSGCRGVNLLSRIQHKFFGHRFEVDEGEGQFWRDKGVFGSSLKDEVTVRAKEKYHRKVCQYCEETEPVKAEGFLLVCQCGTHISSDSRVTAVTMLEEHLEEVEHAVCETCGKVFTGDNPYKARGGHKSGRHT